MSMTRNGTKMMKPMMKAVFSSDSTNAGISVVMLHVVGVLRLRLRVGAFDEQRQLRPCGSA